MILSDAVVGEPVEPDARYLNRELSWLDFNARVLALAEDPILPLLERAKFLAIFSQNLDEFFQVRVSALKDQIDSGLRITSPDGLDQVEQLRAIRTRVDELVTREVSVRQLGGPIAITRASVAAAQSGMESLFLLIAILSVNVAVLNLLPIPILDGGQILINIAESVKGSPFSSRTREYILRFGLAAILLIFAMSTFNDVSNEIKNIVARLFG